MPALNFKAQFADAVESGKKRCTIRGRYIEPGKTLYHFTGMRTKACRRLGTTTCASCVEIRIAERDEFGSGVALRTEDGRALVELSMEAATALAKADGFDSLPAFRQFFCDQYGLPYTGGWLTKWNDKPRKEAE